MSSLKHLAIPENVLAFLILSVCLLTALLHTQDFKLLFGISESLSQVAVSLRGQAECLCANYQLKFQ